MTKELKIIRNYILYFLVFIVVIFYGVSHVEAWTSDGGITYEGIAYLTDSTTISIQADYDTPEGLILELEPNQTYYTRIKKLFIDVDGYNFIGGRQYQLELHFEGIQLNNNANTYKAYAWNTATNALDLCQTSYDETIMSNDAYPRWNFQCPSTTTEIVIHVYNSNDSAITSTGNFRWSYSYLWYTNQSMGSGNDSIINNQNQNADRIIDNQNENTEKILDSQKVCEKVDKNKIISNNKSLASNGVLYDTNGYGTTDFIPITESAEIIPLELYSESRYLCFFTINKNTISCVSNRDLVIGTKLTIPSNASYVMFSINYNVNKPQFTICKDGNQALNDTINNLDDTLKNDSVDENGVADAFDSFNDYLDDNSTITQLITLPITLYTAILNNLDASCQPFNLGNLYGEDLVLPCINISQYLGSSLWSMIDIIISGFAVFAISKKMIKVFNNFSSLREGDVIDD